MGDVIDPYLRAWFDPDANKKALVEYAKRSLLAIDYAISPIIDRMPAITYRAFLRQSVSHAALVAGQRP